MGALGFALELIPRGRRPAGGFDFSGSGLPPGATFARGSAGARHDAAGLVVRDAAGVARFDRDPVTLMPRGLLIEPAATNLLAYSEQFDASAGWTPANAAVAANAATAPDGSATADRLIAGTNSGGQQVAAASTAFVAGTTYTLSGYAKPAGQRYFQLRFPVSVVPGNNRYATFDLQGGAVAALSSGMTAAIEPLPNGWFRCQATKTADASATAGVLAVIVQSAVAAPDPFAGDGVAGVALWGAQLEVAAAASSYVATTTASASRAADAVTLDWSGGWAGDGSGHGAGQGVADGAITLRYRFDDGSTQDVAATVAGGTTIVPTNLNRRWVQRIDKL